MKNDNERNTFFLRNQLLDKTDLVMAQLHQRINVQRFRPNEADNLKLEYLKVLLQAIKIKNEILTDAEQDIYQEPFYPIIPAGSEPKESLFDF